MASSTQGKTLGYVKESSLGTAGGSFTEIRYDDFTFPVGTRLLMANPNKGHQHAFDKSDKPVAYEGYQEKAIKLTTKIRQAAANETTCPIGDFFASMGCSVLTNTHTTIATYASTTSWTLTDDYCTVGQAGLLELNSGVYYPVLAADYVQGTKTVTPSMAIPSVTQAAKAWQPMTTIRPISRAVPATDTVSFEYHTRATHTSGEDLSYHFHGCAAQSVGALAIKPNEAPTLAFDFCLGKTQMISDAISLEVFKCGEKFTIINDDFRFEFADASVAGAIARTDAKVIEAEIDFGVQADIIKGEGNSCYAGMQGLFLKALEPRVKITALFDIDTWTEIESETAATYIVPKYIGLVQPTRSLLTPAFGFWAGSAYIDPANPPTIDFEGDTYVKATVTYLCSSSGYNAETLNAEYGNCPWFFGISGHYIA